MNNQKNNLYYEERNSSKDELIIFLHSNLLNNEAWINQKDYFNDYNCIYVDIPHHGNSYFEDEFSIERSGEIIKDLINEKAHIIEKKNNSFNGSKRDKDKFTIKFKVKKVHLVGVSLGGQIILYLLAKYPNLIDTAIVSGVNIYENINEKNINEIIGMMDKLKVDILDKKPTKFLIKALLSEYGLERKYYDFVKDSIEKINHHDLNSITSESLIFKIPEKKSIEKEKNEEINERTDFNQDLLVLYGTKEYPKIQKSADLIKERFNQAQVFSVYRSIHLWNIIDYKWFNEIITEFISKRNIDLNNKPYLKK